MSDALDVTAKIPRDFESEPTLEGDEPRTIPIEKIELVPPRAARGTRPLPLAPPRAATVPPPIPPQARRARTTTASALPLVAPPEESRSAPADDEPLIEVSVDEPSSADDLAAASLGDRASKTVIVHRPPLRARMGGWLHAVARVVRRAERTQAPAPIAMPIGSVPAGATVTVISDGDVRIVGQTPLAVALDPARTYDVVLALRDHATTLHQLKPHIAAALMVRLERR